MYNNLEEFLELIRTFGFKLSSIHTSNNTIILLHYDTETHPLAIVQQVYSTLNSLINDNSVSIMAMPNSMSLRTCTKEHIEYLIHMLQQCLLQME